jgi:hypothetical protein
MKRRALAAATALALSSCAPRSAYEQTYLPASSNWAFRQRFPRADHLFNAFDYGHATVYETLITQRGAPRRLENGDFDFITRQVLRHPPRVPLEESAIGPRYVTLIPEIAEMFAWAHVLHRQIYDVWAQYGRSDAERDAAVARLVAHYRTRSDLAFSIRPKSMALMEGQAYSLAFRKQDPKFNGLLWSYHWLQMSLYDALLRGGSVLETNARVDSTVGVFFSMLDDAPTRMPEMMPMASDAAPLFSARYPDAANIFDNLHSLHDVVSDILVSPVVPSPEKRRAILAAAATYRDDTTAVMAAAHDHRRPE